MDGPLAFLGRDPFLDSRLLCIPFFVAQCCPLVATLPFEGSTTSNLRTNFSAHGYLKAFPLGASACEGGGKPL